MASQINDIVQFADSSDARELMADVLEHPLPPVLDWLVDEYHTFEGARDRFMWQWVHELAPHNALPFVGPAYLDRVATDKTITILFITLLDDILEKHRDRATFEEASNVPFPRRPVNPDRPGVDADYVRFTQRVWDALVDRLQRSPRFDEYIELLRFDLKQVINAIEYTDLAIREPGLATLPDLSRYQSHNMAMYVYADIDLMHASSDLEDELPTLRTAIWSAQQMARIGNWVSTWERELAEGDFSSGVVTYAMETGVISVADLRALGRDGSENDLESIASRIHDAGIEEEFLDRWDEHYLDLLEYGEEIDAFDLESYAEGLKEVLRYHLASKGLK